MKSQFAALLFSRGMSSVIQAGSLVLLVRWVGAEIFGLVAVITGIAAVVYTLSDWGAASHLPRSRARGETGAVADGLRLSILGNGAAALVFSMAVLLMAIMHSWSPWLVVVPIALAAEQYIEAALTLSVADQAKHIVLVSIAIRRLCSLGIFVILYALGFDPLGSYSLGLLISSIFGLIHIRIDVRQRLVGAPRGRLRPALLRRLFPYVLANISSSSRNLDTSIVAAAASAYDAGLYSAAFRLAKPLNQIGGAASAVLLPHAARSSTSTVKRAGVKLALSALVAMVPLALLGLLSETIVVFLFGNDFSDAAPAFAWAIVSIAPVCLAPPLGSLLQGLGFQRYVAWNGVTFAIVTLVFIWIGILHYELAGAAAGLTIAYILKSSSLIIRILKTRESSAFVNDSGIQVSKEPVS